MFKPGGNAQRPLLRGSKFGTDCGSRSIASLCIMCSPVVQGLRNESEGTLGGLSWVMTPQLPLMWISCGSGLPGVEGVWGYTAEPVCVREDGCSLSLIRRYETAPKFSSPCLGSGECKPGGSTWACGLWPLPPWTQPHLIFSTDVEFGFLVDTIFSLSLVGVFLDLKWLNNSVTFILSSHLESRCLNSQSKISSEGIFRHRWASVVTDSL